MERQHIPLREMLLSYNLSKTIKWGSPVYMKDGKNLIGIAAFKNHYGLWFFQGALLQKNTKLLVNSKEGKTQAMRQIKLVDTSVLDLNVSSKYIEETIALHDQGKKVKLVTPKTVEIPVRFELELDTNLDLNKAFNILSPGTQKEYSLYIIEAKREATKQFRIKKIIPMIMEGIDLNDKHKN